jgi:N-acetylglutamate synthase-like GNAT family acetyltransferase
MKFEDLTLDVTQATENDLPTINNILASEGLPTSDIVLDIIHIYMFHEGDQLVGLTGLETFKSYALLRSVAVTNEFKNKGLGKEIVYQTIMKAKKMGMEDLYLLTTSARGFFERFGFKVINREDAPSHIKSTKEFRELCDKTATCMWLDISAV